MSPTEVWWHSVSIDLFFNLGQVIGCCPFVPVLALLGLLMQLEWAVLTHFNIVSSGVLEVIFATISLVTFFKVSDTLDKERRTSVFNSSGRRFASEVIVKETLLLTSLCTALSFAHKRIFCKSLSNFSEGLVV